MQGARILRPSPALHRAGIRSVSRIRVNAPYKSPRPVIVRAADDADALASAAASLGTFGTVFGTLFLSLFLVEKRSKGSMEAEIDLLQCQLRERDHELKSLREKLEEERRRKTDEALYKKRLDEASRDQLKLERALEMKDGQLESFMSVAQRQIKMLEETVKEQETRIQELIQKP